MRIALNAPQGDDGGNLEIGSVKVPLPTWGRSVLLVFLLLVALVAGTGYAIVWWGDHHHSDKQAAIATAQVEADRLEQLDEAERHFGEVPEKADSMRGSDDPRGAYVVSLFKAGCLFYHYTDPLSGEVRRFVPVSAHKIRPVIVAAQMGSVSLETAAWAEDGPKPYVEPPGCIDPWTAHPGKFSWREVAQRSPCAGTIERSWPDGCTMTEMYECDSTWHDAQWVRCAGH